MSTEDGKREVEIDRDAKRPLPQDLRSAKPQVAFCLYKSWYAARLSAKFKLEVKFYPFPCARVV